MRQGSDQDVRGNIRSQRGGGGDSGEPFIIFKEVWLTMGNSAICSRRGGETGDSRGETVKDGGDEKREK